MRISKATWALVTIFAAARATPADDMQNLQTSCENGANILNSSLNNTAPMNTSGLVQNVTWEVGASTANLGVQNSSSIPLQSTNTTSSNLDSAYFGYVDAIRTFAEALLRRGRIYHQEMNYPVFTAIQGLATAVQTYGLQLGNAGMISRNATIRTFTAGSSLVDAQSMWANNGNYPGVRYRRRRARRTTYG